MTGSTGSDAGSNPLAGDDSKAGTFYSRLPAGDDLGNDLGAHLDDGDVHTLDTPADDAVASGADPDATSSS